MPKWITTQWYLVDYGWDHDSKGGWVAPNTERFSTPRKDLRNSLDELITYLDANQYTIKAVVPKTTGLACYDYSHSTFSGQSYGYGWGYGVTPITGFVVLAQQEREVSAEEYARLFRALTLKNTLPTLREKCKKLQKTIDAEGQKSMEITEKKKLLGGFKYLVGEKEFGSREAAEAALAECAARRAELEETQAEIGRMESELVELTKQP